MEISRRAFCLGTAAFFLVGAAPAARPLEILIMGGTGFLGPALVGAAAGRGHKLTLFHRGKTPLPAGLPAVEQLYGDRNEPLKALEGRRWDAVLDTSGQLPEQVRRSTAALDGHYAFVSTISTYKDHGKPGLTENDAQIQGDADYGGRKARCEELVRAREDYTVVRPGVMGGPLDATDRFTYWVERARRGGRILAPGDGLDPVQLIDVRDVAQFLVRCLEERTFGTFNLTGPRQPLTMAGLLEACGAKEPVWTKGDFDLPLYADRHGDWKGFFQVDSSRAYQAGLTVRPLAESARDVAAWFATQNRPLKTGLSPERERQLLEENART